MKYAVSKILFVMIFFVIILIADSALFASAESSPVTDYTFKEVCSDCHTGGFKGFISGAPSVKKSEQWREFLTNHTAEEMVTTVWKGSGDHKQKGGCKSCSREDIEAAVHYILTLVAQ